MEAPVNPFGSNPDSPYLNCTHDLDCPDAAICFSKSLPWILNSTTNPILTDFCSCQQGWSGPGCMGALTLAGVAGVAVYSIIISAIVPVLIIAMIETVLFALSQNKHKRKRLTRLYIFTSLCSGLCLCLLLAEAAVTVPGYLFPCTTPDPTRAGAKAQCSDETIHFLGAFTLQFTVNTLTGCSMIHRAVLLKVSHISVDRYRRAIIAVSIISNLACFIAMIYSFAIDASAFIVYFGFIVAYGLFFIIFFTINSLTIIYIIRDAMAKSSVEPSHRGHSLLSRELWHSSVQAGGLIIGFIFFIIGGIALGLSVLTTFPAYDAPPSSVATDSWSSWMMNLALVWIHSVVIWDVILHRSQAMRMRCGNCLDMPVQVTDKTQNKEESAHLHKSTVEQQQQQQQEQQEPGVLKDSRRMRPKTQKTAISMLQSSLGGSVLEVQDVNTPVGESDLLGYGEGFTSPQERNGVADTGVQWTRKYEE